MCTVYEGLVLFAVAVFFAYAFSALLRYEGAPGVMRHVFQAYLLAVFGLYFVWFWSRGRRTLPMKTVAVRLLDTHGRPLTPARAALRYCLAAACLVVPVLLVDTLGPGALTLMVLPWLWAVFDPLRCAVYDRLAGTRLVIDAAPRP
jgi:uncharacterized RDD family membrane protein YckC